MKQPGTFVYAVCGDRHVAAVNQSVLFLKHFSRSEIVVVRCRSSAAVDHDQVIDASPPAELDDHQAAIYLKTSLAQTVGGLCCYMDSDVFAVSERVDEIFDYRPSPILFARDQVDIDTFSRHAVNCGCAKSPCRHLRDRLESTFDVRVDYGRWRHWNGGVFLFDEDSAPFMKMWHDLTMLIFDDPMWKTRDQGTLIASAWMSGLQDGETLPEQFNHIVDPFYGVNSDLRPHLTPAEYVVYDDYQLGAQDDDAPRALHLVNQGAGKNGWANWDRLVRYLNAVKVHE